MLFLSPCCFANSQSQASTFFVSFEFHSYSLKIPGPSSKCLSHPSQVKRFFQALEPLFCVLSAIDHIILPHQCLQMESLPRKLGKQERLDGPLTEDLMLHYCVPFPVLHLLSNYSRPTSAYKKGGRRDWVIHTQFGDFTDGIIDLPASAHTGVCTPGTVTAVMDHLIPHGFPPVNGERFILSQVTSSKLLHYAGLRQLPVDASPTIGDVEAAACMESLLNIPPNVDVHEYEWQVGRRPPCTTCNCCWEVVESDGSVISDS